MFDDYNNLDNDYEPDYEPDITYDSPNEIQMCLNCQKPDCDNCLKAINGV